MVAAQTPTGGTTSLPSAWWTRDRLRLAGVAGVTGGVVLTVVAALLNATGRGDIDLETTSGSLYGLTHSVAYLLMLAALIGANVRYRAEYHRLGNLLAYGLGIGMVALALTLPLMSFIFGGDWVVGEAVAGLSFVVVHLLATVFGIVLWRRTSINRVTASLFILVVPAIILVAVLEGAGVINLTPATFEAPLYLGFAGLGYDLWRNERRRRIDGDPISA